MFSRRPVFFIEKLSSHWEVLNSTLAMCISPATMTAAILTWIGVIKKSRGEVYAMGGLSLIIPGNSPFKFTLPETNIALESR